MRNSFASPEYLKQFSQRSVSFIRAAACLTGWTTRRGHEIKKAARLLQQKSTVQQCADDLAAEREAHWLRDHFAFVTNRSPYVRAPDHLIQSKTRNCKLSFRFASSDAPLTTVSGVVCNLPHKTKAQHAKPKKRHIRLSTWHHSFSS